MSDSKYQINANNVQIVETTAGGDVVITKYASEPQVNVALVALVKFLQEVQQKHPEATSETTEFILNAEARTMEQNESQRWLQFQQQLRSLPQDIRDPERWKQGGKNTLVQVTTDLTDNIFLNAVVAFLDGFSSKG
ncbi:MAG: hypothetical protein AAF151_13955 [Cyanobacteria bacterium J06656_5]